MHATAHAQRNGGDTLTTRGDAHRDPAGCGHPVIGEEATRVPHDLCGRARRSAGLDVRYADTGCGVAAFICSKRST
ncbi:hypothetical protein ACVWWN_002877 [Mycobacterium sp. URHB0021]|jgi:hypothetical protein